MTRISAGEKLQIQLKFALPLLKDLQDILGEEVVLHALKERLNRRIAKASRNSKGPGVPDANALNQGFRNFGSGGNLAFELIATDAEEVAIDVRHCQHAQVSKELDATEIGALLACGEDYVMMAAAGIELDRQQTIMTGGKRCNFRFRPGSPS